MTLSLIIVEGCLVLVIMRHVLAGQGLGVD